MSRFCVTIVATTTIFFLHPCHLWSSGCLSYTRSRVVSSCQQMLARGEVRCTPTVRRTHQRSSSTVRQAYRQAQDHQVNPRVTTIGSGIAGRINGTFWDGDDPSTQSFFTVTPVPPSTSRQLEERRPSSAPTTRCNRVAPAPCLPSCRPSTSGGRSHVTRGCDIQHSDDDSKRHQELDNGRRIGVAEALERVRTLELRVDDMETENARLRGAMRERQDLEALKFIAGTQRRTLEVITSLQRDKEMNEKGGATENDRPEAAGESAQKCAWSRVVPDQPKAAPGEWGSHGRRESPRLARRSLIERSLETARERFQRRTEQRQLLEEIAECEAQKARDSLKKIARSGTHGTAPKGLLAREQEANRRREEREAARQAQEQQDLKLGSSFRATKVPAKNIPNWAEIETRQELLRKKRVKERAAHVAANSFLPPRMAYHEPRGVIAQHRSEPKVRGITAGAGAPAGRTNDADRPGRTAVIDVNMTCDSERVLKKPQPEDIGQALLRSQKRWATSLAAAKAALKTAVTKPRTPPMEVRRLEQQARRNAKNEACRAAQAAVLAEEEEKVARRRINSSITALQPNKTEVAETNASRKKAEETRKRRERDFQAREDESKATIAREARRREMSRAVKAYVERSEARRRGEQGGGVSLEVLVKRKKEEMEAEFRERRRKNQEGLEQALRKRLNLMERQDQHGQIRSKQLFAEATSVRSFLESRDGFTAAGRRASSSYRREGRNSWKTRAREDDDFNLREKEKLGVVDSDSELKGELQDKNCIESVDHMLLQNEQYDCIPPYIGNKRSALNADGGTGASAQVTTIIGEVQAEVTLPDAHPNADADRA